VSTVLVAEEIAAAVAGCRAAGAGLVLALVAPGDDDAFSALAAALGLPYVNASLELARRLLDVPVGRRAWRAGEALPTLVDAALPAVALGRLGLLHLPELQIDPLRALQQLARTRVVLAEWQGTLEDGRLTYARPGHAEYRSWPLPAAAVIPLTPAPGGLPRALP